MKNLRLIIPIVVLQLLSANISSYEPSTRYTINKLCESCKEILPATETEQREKAQRTYTYEQKLNYMERLMFAVASCSYLQYASNSAPDMPTQIVFGTLALIGTTFFIYKQTQHAAHIQKLEVEKLAAERAFYSKIIKQIMPQLQPKVTFIEPCKEIAQENIGWLEGLLKRQSPQLPTDQELQKTKRDTAVFWTVVSCIITLAPHTHRIYTSIFK